MKTPTSDAVPLEKRAFNFALEIFSVVILINKIPILWDLGRQVTRSGSSIAANIAEAKYASSRKDFTNFYRIALKSAHETRFWLELCVASIKKEIPNNVSASLVTAKCTVTITEVIQIENILWASIKTLGSKR